MKKKKYWLWLSGIILIAITIALLSRDNPNNQIVLTLNEYEVTAEEFDIFLQASKALTISYFQSEYGAEYNKDFWQTSFAGEVPLMYVKEQSLQKLKEYKVEQMMMVEEGIIEDIHFSVLFNDWKQENRDRQQKLQDNEPIYGPKQFQRFEYLQYNHLLHLQKLLDKQVQQLREEYNDAFFEAYYEQIKSTYFKKRNRFDYDQIILPKMEYAEQLGLETTSEEKHLDLSFVSKDDVFHHFLFEQFLEMEEGEVTERFDEDEQYDIIYRLTNIYDDGYELYEDVKHAIPQYYAQELMEETLQEKLQVVEVAMNERVYNRLRMDDR